MVSGSWDPREGIRKQQVRIERQWLRRFIEWAKAERLGELPDLLSEDDRRKLAAWMQAEPADWITAVQPLSDTELVALIRFLTIAEMKVPGWECGEKSPVIAVAGVLKQRGGRLDRALLQWIRENSDNRYIPNGPAL